MSLDVTSALRNPATQNATSHALIATSTATLQTTAVTNIAAMSAATKSQFPCAPMLATTLTSRFGQDATPVGNISLVKHVVKNIQKIHLTLQPKPQ